MAWIHSQKGVDREAVDKPVGAGHILGYEKRAEAHTLVDLRAEEAAVSGYGVEDPDFRGHVAASKLVDLITGAQSGGCPVELPFGEGFEEVRGHRRDGDRGCGYRSEWATVIVSWGDIEYHGGSC